MVSRPKDLNLYHKVSAKIKLIGADIRFLKTCKRNQVFPNFIKVNIPVNCRNKEKIALFTKQKWLNSEIEYLYSKRSNLELQAYRLWKSLTLGLNESEFQQWCEFQRKMFVSIDAKVNNKVRLHQKKLNKLVKMSKVPNISQKDINIVENLSTQTFNKLELKLLNQGLKFCVRSPQTEVEEVIAGIESSIQQFNEPTKHFVREACKLTIAKNMNSPFLKPFNNVNNNIIKSLQKKDCFYVKADKGNKVVILDKKDYYDRVNNLIANGPYQIITKNPLPRMVREVNNALKTCSNLVTPQLKLKLLVSNPVIPKLYCLPKIHKPGNSMRPIVSAINAPTYKLSKWLTNEFNNLPVKQPSFAVKNSLEFINKVRDITLQPGEVLVSFDVSSLFPSVPISQTLTYLEDLLVQNGLDQQTIKEYIQLTKLCMKQNICQFNGHFFEQLEGTAMGNSLSPFLADLFMSRFEKDLENELEYFPKVWWRYVDDIFAVFDTNKCSIDNFLNILNNRVDNIKFTYELEDREQLPFLDVLVLRNKNRLEFDIYRKTTSTLRYIPSESHHCLQHKMASLNFLVNRLLTFPLTEKRYKIELAFIKHVARCNGYDPEVIDKIVNRFKFKKLVNESSTFRKDPEKTTFVTIPFAPQISRGLEKIFKRLDRKVIYTSGSSLQSLLGNPKDKVGEFEKSGIYEIQCKDCNKKYIGQTKRSIETRFKEHMAHLRFGRFEKSSVAQHVFENDHHVDKSCLKLVKSVNNCRYLNSLESLEIYKNSHCVMNSDGGPIRSSLFTLVRSGGDRCSGGRGGGGT